jgi:hypothetical protein
MLAPWIIYASAMDNPATAKRKHLNATERRALRAADAVKFIQQYGRKAQRGKEPNDRWLVKDMTRAIKQMNPADFDQLLRDDEDHMPDALRRAAENSN